MEYSATKIAAVLIENAKQNPKIGKQSVLDRLVYQCEEKIVQQKLQKGENANPLHHLSIPVRQRSTITHLWAALGISAHDRDAKRRTAFRGMGSGGQALEECAALAFDLW